MDSEILARSAGDCLGSFESCITKTTETKEVEEIDVAEFLDTECGRFRIWADGIGVFAGGHASLDYRLRDSPPVKDLLLGQLNIVRKHLTRGKIITLHPNFHEEIHVSRNSARERSCQHPIWRHRRRPHQNQRPV
jgi:hypothetical protein